MSVTIIHKKGSGVPAPESLEVAEVAVDVVTGTLYTKTNNGKVIEIGSSGDGSGGDSLWEQNGNDIYYNDGSVGVGTNDPKSKFQVCVGTDLNIAMNQLTAEDVARISAYDDAVSASVPLAIEGEYLKLRTNNKDQVIVNNAGNVGVGTNDPKALLHSNGVDGELARFQGVSAQLRMYSDADGFFTLDNVANGKFKIRGAGEDRLTIDAAGNVLMPDGYLEHKGKIYTIAEDTSYVEMDATTGTALIRGKKGGVAGYSYILESSTGNATFYGNVGIGMAPTRSTFDLSAKEQLKEWKTKAKKASWPVVTDGAFEQEPTEELVAQWIETRAAGDRLQVAGNISANGSVQSNNGKIIAFKGDGQYAMLDTTLPRASLVISENGIDSSVLCESNGNISATGTVNAGNIHTGLGNDTSEVRIHSTASGTSTLAFYKDNAPVVTQQVQASGDGFYWGALGAGGAGFRNVGGYQYSTDSWRFTSQIATFSGAVQANTVTANKGDFGSSTLAYNNGTTTSGISAIIESTSSYANTLAHTNTGLEFRSNSTTRGWLFQNASGTKLTIAPSGEATFSGAVDAAGFTINGVPISGGLPDGDFTHNGKITATDFIATSDERLKDNITPMPIGLIDDIKPVSWDWKDGSGTSAGVVAQQLQAVGLGDYVHENEDGQLGVNYQALTAILLAEVIELKKAIK